jgi:hypothetical protein
MVAQDILETPMMAIVSDQQTWIMTLIISHQCMNKVLQSKIALMHAMLMRPVMPLTLVQKMDTAMPTSRMLLLNMLEVEEKVGHATTG